MAKEDIEALREDGIELTVDEIIRLNAFGLKVERNAESSELYFLPRVAVIADVALREPTIGSEIWLKSVSSVFDMEDPETFIQVRTLSLASDFEALPEATDKELIVAEIQKLFKRLSGTTLTQLMNALEYCINGNLATDGEKKARRKPNGSEDPQDEVDNECFEIGVLNNGLIFKLGTPEDLKKMTTSRLLALIQYKKLMKYGLNSKEAEARHLGQYYAVLEEIKEAHSK